MNLFWFLVTVLPISLIGGILSAFMVIHVIRTWSKEEKDSYKKINEIVHTLLTIAISLYYPLIILRFGNEKVGQILPSMEEEFSLLGLIFIAGTMTIIGLWAYTAKVRVMRNSEKLKELNNYNLFCIKLCEVFAKKSKIKRKITHIIPGFVVIIVILLFYATRSLFYGNWYNYAVIFIVIIGIDFAFTFLIADIIRLFNFNYMPPNAIKLCMAGLTPNELDSFSSTSVMVFGFGPFIFFKFPIFLITLLITSVADAFASIFGKLARNKHFFPRNTQKTLEGYMAGVIFTIICTFSAVLISNLLSLSTWTLELTTLLSAYLSIAFLIIDITTSKIKLQDNYLNPIIIGLLIIIVLSNLGVEVLM